MSRFAVLHVCMGNICRSPMAERLLPVLLAERLAAGRGADVAGGTGATVTGTGLGAAGIRRDPAEGDREVAGGGDEGSRGDAGGSARSLVSSASAAVGRWHVGEPMSHGSARQVSARGGDASGFRARLLEPEHVDAADLILTATVDQVEDVVAMRPDARARTFVLGEFARLAAAVDETALPPYDPGERPNRDQVTARGVALVAAADAVRAGQPANQRDEVSDPYGGSDAVFGAVAGVIERHLATFADRLLP